MTPALTQGARAALQAAAFCGVVLQGEDSEIVARPEGRLGHAARGLLLAYRWDLSRFLLDVGCTSGGAKAWTAADTAALMREAA